MAPSEGQGGYRYKAPETPVSRWGRIWEGTLIAVLGAIAWSFIEPWAKSLYSPQQPELLYWVKEVATFGSRDRSVSVCKVEIFNKGTAPEEQIRVAADYESGKIEAVKSWPSGLNSTNPSDHSIVLAADRMDQADHFTILLLHSDSFDNPCPDVTVTGKGPRAKQFDPDKDARTRSAFWHGALGALKVGAVYVICLALLMRFIKMRGKRKTRSAPDPFEEPKS